MKVDIGQYNGIQLVKLDDGTLVSRDNTGFHIMFPTAVHKETFMQQINAGDDFIGITFDATEVEKIIKGFEFLDQGYGHINPYKNKRQNDDGTESG